MSAADLREALRLLDAVAVLLERRHVPPPASLRDELRRLTQQLDHLRVRAGQAPANSQRN